MKQEITAVELGRAETVAFFREIMAPDLRADPFARWIVRNVDGIPDDPAEAAEGRIVFEVHREPRAGAPTYPPDPQRG